MKGIYDKFTEYHKKAVEIIGTTSMRIVPSAVVMSDFISLNNKTYSYGSEWDKNILLISSKLPKHLQDAVIAREAFHIALPEQLRQIEATYDLAWEFGREQLSESLARDWIKIWSMVSKRIKIANITYNPSYSFPVFYKIRQGNFLEELFAIFSELLRYNVEIKPIDYFTILENYMYTQKYPFTKDNLIILDYLVRNPEAKIAELVKVCGYSQGKVYHELKKLKKLNILSKKYAIKYDRLDMDIYFILIHNIPNFKKVLNMFSLSPFIYSLNPFYDTKGGIIAFFLVPRHKNNITSVKNLFLSFREPNAKFAKVTTSFSKYNFSLYNPDFSYSWKLHPYGWLLWAKKVLKAHNWYDLISPERLVIDRGSVVLEHINKLDIEILAQLQHNYLSVRMIQKKLRKNTNEIIKSMKKLKELGVLYTKIDVFMTGLNEVLSLWVEGDKEIILSLLATLNDLPRHNTALFDFKTAMGLFSFIYLPDGYIIPFSRAIQEVLCDSVTELEIHTTGMTLGGEYKFPVELWNDQEKKWKGIINK